MNYKNITNEVGELKPLKSVRYDCKSFPKNYAPKIGKNSFFPKTWVQGTIDKLNEGEIWIEMRKFKKQGDGAIKIVFINTGWRFVGGAEVTYSAWQKNGKWLVEFEGANDS